MSGSAPHHASLADPPGLPRIGEPAPPFRVRTTQGIRALADYRGRWLLFFAHPADFTPVCTTELVAFAKAHDRFAARNCDLLALSVDSVYAHLAWLGTIRERLGVTVPFPIAEDVSLAIARAYGMLHPSAGDTATVRATFLIDPHGIVRVLLYYPMSMGRNVEEILRVVAAAQETDARGVSTPVDWQPGDPTLLPAPQTAAEAEAARSDAGAVDWFFRREGASP